MRLIPILLFLLVGASLIIEPKDLQNRLTMYLTIFVFTVGFSNEIKEYLPFHMGFTNAERLLYFLVITQSIFLICSIMTSELQRWYKEYADLISLVGDLSSILFSLCLGVILPWSFPSWRYFIKIVVSLSYGLVIRLLLSKEYHNLSKEYHNLRVKIAKRFRNFLSFF